MKRFTLILSLLVAMVTTAIAQQSITVSTEADPVYYVIASYNRGGYLTNAGVGSSVEHIALAEGSYWYFESAGDDGSVYFVNKLKDGDSKIYLGSDKKASTTAAKWYILPNNNVNKKGMSISSTNPISSKSCIDANNYDSGVGSWNPSASDWHGTTWVFVDCVNEKYNPANLIFRSRADRYVNTISLGEESATIDRDYAGDNGRAYFDLTKSVTFEVYAEQEVTPAITRDGGWTNAYAYIDLAGDGFTASVGENGAPGDDLVSYSFYSGDEANDTEGLNSIGESLSKSDRNTIAMPSFTAPSEPGTYRMRFKHDWNSINPNGSNTNFMSNGGSIIDVTLIVKEVVATATINYSYQFNGVEKFTQTSTGYVGDEYPALTETAKFPYGITATKPAGTIAESDIIDGVINKVIELTTALPFTCSDSYENVKWQFLKFHASRGYYLNNNATAEQNYIALNSKNYDADNDNYYWGFVGNPFDGFKIVNKGAGEGYILSAATVFTDNGTTYPVMTELTNLPDGNNELWVVTKSTNAENGFYIAQKGFPNNAMNNYAGNGKLTFWQGGFGDGSTFIAEDADVVIAAVVSEFKTRAIEGLGYVGGYAADNADAINAISTYAEMEAFKAAKTPIAFDENKFYRIQNVYRKTFIGLENNNRVLRPEDHADIDQLWQVEAGTDDAHFIKSPNAGYMQAVGNNTLVAETDAQFVISSFYEGAGQFGITSKGSTDMLAGINESALGKWWNGTIDSDMSYRFIEADDVEINLSDINGEGWATTYLPFDVTLPEGLTAYYVNEIHDGWVNFAEAADIPANNGVVLYTKEPKTYTLTIADATTEIAENYLKGTTVDTHFTEKAYVLSKFDGVVGFYKTKYNVSTNTENDGTAEEPAVTYEAWLNNANKAYLVVPAAEGTEVASYSFRFGEGTTGIEKVEIRNEKSEIYDLTGRRVEEITAPGIYVVNGKKVLVK